MAHPLVIVAGMLMLGGAQGQSSMRGYDKFITPNLQHFKHGHGPDAFAGTSPSDIEEKQAVQKPLANDGMNPISLSAIGIGLLSLVTMLGLRLRRGLQPATILASSAGLGPDMHLNTSSAPGNNVMELKFQDPNVNSGVARTGWGQLASQTSRPLTRMHGMFDFILDGFKNETYDDRRASASHILVESQEECDSIKGEIAEGLPFGEAASKYSTCPSGKSGGSLGSFEPGKMVKEFDDVVFDESVPVGEVTGPVKTQFGYHLIVVKDRFVNQDRSEGSSVF
jgi:peptidyl-prolyl cis-trans isomerase C